MMATLKRSSFIFTFLVILQGSSVVAQQQVNSTVVLGRDVTLPCNITSTTSTAYSWYLGTQNNHSDQNVDTLGSRFKVKDGSLEISNVQREDEQWYWCVASDETGEVHFKTYLEVLMLPIFTHNSSQNSTQAPEGHDIEIVCRCEAKTYARMFFQRVGNSHRYTNGYQTEDPRIHVYERRPPSNTQSKLVVPQELVLRITNVTLNDTTNYTCIAENTIGQNQTVISVIIQHPPKYNLKLSPSINQSRQSICEGSTTNVTILLSGFPEPTVQWSREDGRHVPLSGDGYETYVEHYWENGRPDEWMVNLQIDWQAGNIQSAYKPTGRYLLEASNSLGRANYVVIVEKGEILGRGGSITTEANAYSITLALELPNENSCLQIDAVEVLFKKYKTNDYNQVVLFPLGQIKRMRLDDLNPATSYKISVYARNIKLGQRINLYNLIARTSELEIPGIILDNKNATISELETTTNSLPAVTTKSPDYSFTCTFETGLCGWAQNVKDDQFNWIRHRGSTSTTLTGPSSDHTTRTVGGWYMYIEASFRKISGYAAMLDYKFPSPVNGGCLSLYYHMYGPHIGSLSIQLLSTGGDKETLWKKTGNQANAWRNVRVPVKQGTHTMRIIGTYGISFRGDIAIDDIKYTAESCDQAFTPTTAPSGLINCTFDSDLCGWKQESNDLDSFDWSTGNGKTSSFETGPSSARRAGGKYLYIEASAKRRGEAATLAYTFTQPVEKGCISLYYHMYGSGTGTLRIESGETESSTVLLWSLSGDQGDRWQHLSLPIYQRVKTVKITGVVGNSYRGDIAIDDITYTSAQCPQVLKRLEYKAQYRIDCNALENQVTKAMITTSASFHVDIIRQLCMNDCYAADVAPKLSCEADMLVVRWPTDTTYHAGTPTIPSALQHTLTARIAKLTKTMFKITISTNVPPTVYPEANQDGSIMKPVLQTECIDPKKTYNKDNNACE